ncbi:MAG TPA: NlpC/P60 family protein [Candidatus Angelobacter sp.]|nr:NlpC/P60 family protein [Candidatus Angelobacter sp.]
MKPGLLLFFIAVVAVWGTSNAAAQYSHKQNLRLHVDGFDDQGWTEPATVEPARDSLLRVALAIRETSLDCSHLVHELFERAGLPYSYAPSVELYKGEVSAFRRTWVPQAGDIVVWMGHVGVVVDPEAKLFVSALRSGVKVSAYDSRYWQRRGHPRFFRYVLDREGVRRYVRVARNHTAYASSPDE